MARQRRPGRIVSRPRPVRRAGHSRERYTIELGELELLPRRLRRISRSMARDIPQSIVRIMTPRFRRAPVPILTGRLRRTSQVIWQRANRRILVRLQYYGYWVDQGTRHIRPRGFVGRIFLASTRELGREIRQIISRQQ